MGIDLIDQVQFRRRSLGFRALIKGYSSRRLDEFGKEMDEKNIEKRGKKNILVKFYQEGNKRNLNQWRLHNF